MTPGPPHTCEHCLWWRKNEGGLPGWGECHAHAPEPRTYFNENRHGLTLHVTWPATHADWGCGEYQPHPVAQSPERKE